MRTEPANLASAAVDPTEDLLLRLALNDERVLGMVLTRKGGTDHRRRINVLARPRPSP
jgi:hypothetical protein